MRFLRFFLSINFVLFISSFNLFPALADEAQEPQINFLFRDSYYAEPTTKLKYDLYEVEGLLLVKDSKRLWHSDFSVVTGFNGSMLESRTLKNVRTIEEAKAYLEKNVRKINFERIPIKELPLVQKDGSMVSAFWVGQRAYPSLDEAKASIINTKTSVESGKGNFDRALDLVTQYFPEKMEPTPEQIRANYEREEELALKMMDWLDIGTKMYGPFMGTPMGEKILWQSFGKGSFMSTSLDHDHFDLITGYWTNRVVFKGIKFIGEPTLDPYVEVTVASDISGRNYPKHLDLIAGVEYRPFGRNAFFENYNIGGLHLLKFARNYRAFVQYMERKPLSDDILGSRDTDVWAGVDIFYEWGLDLERPWVTSEHPRILDWVSDYVWGEYYGTYHFEKSDFSAFTHFNSWIFNSSVVMGVKWPNIPLPANPINNNFTLMPYLRFEHTTNPNRDLSYQNQMFVSAGIRWMPFRSYQFENDEWLFKTKFFAECVALGGVFNPGPSHTNNVPDRDFRAGIEFSYRRF